MLREFLLLLSRYRYCLAALLAFAVYLSDGPNYWAISAGIFGLLLQAAAAFFFIAYSRQGQSALERIWRAIMFCSLEALIYRVVFRIWVHGQHYASVYSTKLSVEILLILCLFIFLLSLGLDLTHRFKTGAKARTFGIFLQWLTYALFLSTPMMIMHATIVLPILSKFVDAQYLYEISTCGYGGDGLRAEQLFGPFLTIRNYNVFSDHLKVLAATSISLLAISAALVLRAGGTVQSIHISVAATIALCYLCALLPSLFEVILRIYLF